MSDLAETAAERASRTESHPAELREFPRREIRGEWRCEIAAHERKAEEGPEARDLISDSVGHDLLAVATRDVGVGRVELVRADARVDEGSPSVHVLHALLEAPARIH